MFETFEIADVPAQSKQGERARVADASLATTSYM